MASGITHMLLMKDLQQRLPSGNLKNYLAMGRDFLQVGAVAPDLPYASLMDGDWFFSNDNEQADNFHYVNTNQIPLKAFLHIKTNFETYSPRERIFLFCFFLGYMSHIIADGIVHPFVRDKVGEYNENQKAHRQLEMNLDVLYYSAFTRKFDQANFNESNLHKEIENIYSEHYFETSKILVLFSSLIKEVYNEDFSKEEILGWIQGLYRMLDLAEGNHHPLYKGLLFSLGFSFADLDELKEKSKEITLLTIPKDRDLNFLHTESISFFDDIIPRFYEIFIPVAEKAYSYLFEEGELLTEEDIALIDLDNGRLLSQRTNLDLIPKYWS